jgi:anti-sigma factor RsiW
VTTAIPNELTCRELVELVTDYLEDRMSPRERERFEEHLHWCMDCTRYVGQLRKTIELAGQLREEDVSPTAQARLLHTFRHWKMKTGGET